MSNLDQIAEKILKARPERATSLVLVNESAKQYTVVILPVGWRVTDKEPFDLQQDGYKFISRWQVGICPPEMP